MTDPMDALVSFQPAFAANELPVQKGKLDRSILVHLDHPLGEPRFTYARTKGKKVVALVVITMVEHIGGVPCFGIGYAVPEDERRRGAATSLAKDALAELQHGLAGAGIKDFYVEAVVGVDNVGSQRVAAATLSDSPKESVDGVSGEPCVVYLRRFGSSA